MPHPQTNGFPPAPSSSAPGPRAFTDQKRGEVNDLKQLLRLAQNDRSDHQKQREALKKVIAFMTLGIDVSCLFSEMIMACGTADIVQKKMIYLYLSTYAETNAELSLLVVNTLQKDCLDDDPTVRGIALKSLCSLRAANIVEYLEPAVRRGLSDCSGYVRRAAVIGVLRIFHMDPQLVIGNGLPPLLTEEEVSLVYTVPTRPADESLVRILFALLNDVDPQVVCNTINALNEILASSGGLPVTRRLAARLLNRIKQFHDGAQCFILNLISQYEPINEADVYDVLNMLEDQLKQSSSAIILATARCFLKLAKAQPSLRLAILKRLCSPFLTLITTSCVEISYIVLLHLQHLLITCATPANDNTAKNNAAGTDEQDAATRLFESDFKLFYCAYSEPAYVKSVKIDLLTLIVTPNTAGPILDELAEYVIIDREPSIVQKAIEGLGKIGSRYPRFMELVTDQLVGYMDLGIDFITAPSFVILQNFLRQKPELFPRVAASIDCHLLSLKEPESLAACLWMIGVFGEQLPSAPYLIEDFVNLLESGPSATGEQTEAADCLKSDAVLFELITAAVRVLLTRPLEMQRVCGRLFRLLLENDSISFDARDRVLFMYRFLYEARHQLRSPITLLQQTLDPFRHSVMLRQDGVRFLEDLKTAHIESLEFDTLSLVLKLPPKRLLAVKHCIPFCGRFVSCTSSFATSLVNPEAPGDSTDASDYLEFLRVRAPRGALPRDDQKQKQSSITPPSVKGTVTPSLPHEASSSRDDNNSLSLVLEPQEDLLDLKEPMQSHGSPESLELSFNPNPSAVYDKSAFELLWVQEPKQIPTRFTLQPLNIPLELLSSENTVVLQTVQKAFESCSLRCAASEFFTPKLFKWFVYGIFLNPPKTVMLIEFSVNLSETPFCLLLDFKTVPYCSFTEQDVVVYLKQSHVLFAELFTS